MSSSPIDLVQMRVNACAGLLGLLRSSNATLATCPPALQLIADYVLPSLAQAQAPAPVLLKKGCYVCGKYDKVVLCGSCRCISYCGSACQTKDWPRHKSRCIKLKPMGGRISTKTSSFNQLKVDQPEIFQQLMIVMRLPSKAHMRFDHIIFIHMNGPETTIRFLPKQDALKLGFISTEHMTPPDKDLLRWALVFLHPDDSFQYQRITIAPVAGGDRRGGILP